MAAVLGMLEQPNESALWAEGGAFFSTERKFCLLCDGELDPKSLYSALMVILLPVLQTEFIFLLLSQWWPF